MRRSPEKSMNLKNLARVFCIPRNSPQSEFLRPHYGSRAILVFYTDGDSPSDIIGNDGYNMKYLKIHLASSMVMTLYKEVFAPI